MKTNTNNKKYMDSKKRSLTTLFQMTMNKRYIGITIKYPEGDISDVLSYASSQGKDNLFFIGVYFDYRMFDQDSLLDKYKDFFCLFTEFKNIIPVLHYANRRNVPKQDIEDIKIKMPYVSAIQVNDINNYEDLLEGTLKSFETVIIPISDKNLKSLENASVISQIKDLKAYILLDNSMGRGVQEFVDDTKEKINKLLDLQISSIALAGGFGPGDLDNYFSICGSFDSKFSIDAESRLREGNVFSQDKAIGYIKELL